MNILVCDKHASDKLILEVLAKLGHKTELVHDGNAAWQRIPEKHFHMILATWKLPGLSGRAVCAKTRALREIPYPYFVLLHAEADGLDRRDAIQAGVDDLLQLPVTEEALLMALAKAERMAALQDRFADRLRSIEAHVKWLEVEYAKLTEEQEDLQSTCREMETSVKISEYAKNRFSQLFDGLPTPCFTYDAGGNVFECNRKLVELFGLQMHQILGKKIRDLLGEDMIGDREEHMALSIFQGSSFTDQDWNNGALYLLVNGHPIYGPDNMITGGIISAIDITRQRRLEKQLEALATTDSMTKLPNHRAFRERLAILVAEADRGRKFCLAILDIDHFKHFNDSFGHKTGDAILIQVGDTLKNRIRKTDLAARYGGEEFCVLYTDVDEALAVKLADERLRAAVSAIQSPHRPITVSIGVCAFNAGMRDGDDLIKAADEALYHAKRTGRDRVVGFSEL